MILEKKNLYSIENANEKIEVNILKSCFKDMSKALLKNKYMLGKYQAVETGKGIKFCIKEVERAALLLEYGIEFIENQGRKRKIEYGGFNGTYLSRNIRGKKILAISTFSSPYSSFIHKMMGAVLAGGIIYFKPSVKAYKCSIMLYKVLEKVMYKYNLHNVHLVVGIRNCDMKKILTKLNFDILLFTGKSETAKEIKKLVPNRLGIYETGSNAMAYISEFYDCRKLRKKLCELGFAQSGMRCIALKNLFVHRDSYKAVKDFLLEDIKCLKVGDPQDIDTDIGPIKDSYTLSGLYNYIKFLETKGYDVLMGGRKEKEFLMPTLLEDKNLNKETSIREIYGPIMIIHCVNSFKEIPIEYYKRSSLQSAIYSDNPEEVDSFIQWNKYCGNICINYGPTLRIDSLPFGGLYDENEGCESLENIVRIASFEQLIIKEDED